MVSALSRGEDRDDSGDTNFLASNPPVPLCFYFISPTSLEMNTKRIPASYWLSKAKHTYVRRRYHIATSQVKCTVPKPGSDVCEAPRLMRSASAHTAYPPAVPYALLFITMLQDVIWSSLTVKRTQTR